MKKRKKNNWSKHAIEREKYFVEREYIRKWMHVWIHNWVFGNFSKKGHEIEKIFISYGLEREKKNWSKHEKYFVAREYFRKFLHLSTCRKIEHKNLLQHNNKAHWIKKKYT